MIQEIFDFLKCELFLITRFLVDMCLKETEKNLSLCMYICNAID